MHSVLSLTESQQSRSPDGEHPTHFSQIEIAILDVMAALCVHVSL